MPHVPTSPDSPAWQATVLTLFPGRSPGRSRFLTGQALAAGIWACEAVDIRAFGIGRHRQVDDTPAGGGPGMVLRADVLGAAIDAARTGNPQAPALYLSPRGEPLRQPLVRELAARPGVLLVAGRSKASTSASSTGGDCARSRSAITCWRGELAAMVLIEACVRLLPGVIGAAQSLARESFEDDVLEYPHYTRPRVGRPSHPRSAARAITPASRSGAAPRRCASRGPADRIFSRGAPTAAEALGLGKVDDPPAPHIGHRRRPTPIPLMKPDRLFEMRSFRLGGGRSGSISSFSASALSSPATSLGSSGRNVRPRPRNASVAFRREPAAAFRAAAKPLARRRDAHREGPRGQTGWSRGSALRRRILAPLRPPDRIRYRSPSSGC